MTSWLRLEGWMGVRSSLLVREGVFQTEGTAHAPEVQSVEAPERRAHLRNRE